MAATSYTVFLLKESVANIRGALDLAKPTTEHPLDPNFGLSGALFVGEQKETTPPWVELLNPYLRTPVKSATAANISALLLLEYEKRVFAFTFGHGRSLLAPSCWVRDFGLKVTLNRVDPSKLRSIDSKVYDDLVRTRRTQTSRSSAMSEFELDVARDLVRGVTGEPKSTTFFNQLVGADGLKFSTPIAFADIGDLLNELLEAYKDDAYKKNFGWIDNVKETDPQIAHELDALLVGTLRKGEIDGMHLAPADILNWGNCGGFNFTCGDRNSRYVELELGDYLRTLGAKCATLELSALHRHQVRVYHMDEDELRDMWSVYDCLVWETAHNGGTYVLFDGRWFEIANSYCEYVSDFAAALAVDAIKLPTGIIGDDEDVYNAAVAKADPTQFALLDRVMVESAGAATPIEFCDLFTTGKHLIHVKKRSSSATLSHLFSQGSVSGDLFLRDSTLRKDVATKLREMKKTAHADLISRDRPSAPEFRVVYAVLAPVGKVWPPRLPFFSAVNLMHHAGLIQSLGFQVSLQHVQQLPKPPVMKSGAKAPCAN